MNVVLVDKLYLVNIVPKKGKTGTEPVSWANLKNIL
jgi:hypothetical protein